ncbi:class I adenylate-forming enzyme family protein [Phenylobacterium sp.]|jgi:long-chain acyl-CoA synthetase|uniref:class I adenylate-forming enzyme family protein n=1 Tax=Phenylobacterium sp. TaxID=1871053 RepID=UPI0037839A5B
MTPAELLALDFGTLPDLIRVRAQTQGERPAAIDPARTVSYAELDRRMDRVAAALQRDGVGHGEVAAICAASRVEYLEAFFGTLRAAGVVAPLAPSSTPDSLLAQLADSGAKVLFLDRQVADHLGPALGAVAARRVSLDGSDAGVPFDDWLADEEPVRRDIAPEDTFNIIYSSGTTGVPKGIRQPHAMRWAHMRRAVYPNDAVTLLSTPLYSNTTLVSLLPTIAAGGCVVLMAKFDAEQFLALSQAHRVTHAMLVPVQYQRLMDHPRFDDFDLTAYRMKFATSAPFPAELKRRVLDRWPGGLVEFYGMTEGGGTCALEAHAHPDKLHTVGRPLPGHDVRLIGDDGAEVEPGGVGEVVGRSGAMMTGYHNQPAKTAEIEWRSPDGLRYLRSGDVGRFDADGFLVLMDRKKDMIISGGFNIYPGDVEAELTRHPAVLEAAVVGVPSRAWGETPVGFVALRPEAAVAADALRAEVNARLGKHQRLSDLRFVEALPRSAIGKVLKRELREAYAAEAAPAAHMSDGRHNTGS